MKQFPHYRLQGRPREVGRQHGEALRETIRAHLDLIYTQGTQRSQISPDSARRWALAFGPIIADAAPDGDIVLHLDLKRPFAPQPAHQVAAKLLLTLFHWMILALAAYGLARGTIPRRVKIGLMIPIVFAFGTIMFYGIQRLQGFEGLEPLARYRFPSEPFILILAVSGAYALQARRKR